MTHRMTVDKVRGRGQMSAKLPPAPTKTDLDTGSSPTAAAAATAGESTCSRHSDGAPPSCTVWTYTKLSGNAGALAAYRASFYISARTRASLPLSSGE